MYKFEGRWGLIYIYFFIPAGAFLTVFAIVISVRLVYNE